MRSDIIYIVCSDKILLETEDLSELDRFLNELCKKYRKELEGSHEVFIKKGDRYLYHHATWFGFTGVSSRGPGQPEDQTERFIKQYISES